MPSKTPAPIQERSGLLQLVNCASSGWGDQRVLVAAFDSALRWTKAVAGVEGGLRSTGAGRQSVGPRIEGVESFRRLFQIEAIDRVYKLPKASDLRKQTPRFPVALWAGDPQALQRQA